MKKTLYSRLIKLLLFSRPETNIIPKSFGVESMVIFFNETSLVADMNNFLRLHRFSESFVLLWESDAGSKKIE